MAQRGSNIFSLYAYRQRDYSLVGTAVYVTAMQQDVDPAVAKLVESFKANNTTLNTGNSRLCIKTKNGFHLHLLYSEYQAVGVPLGIILIAAVRDTHRATLVNSFLNDVSRELGSNPQALRAADSSTDRDAISRPLMTASMTAYKRYDTATGDALGQIHSDMGEIRDAAAHNVDKLRINHDRLDNIAQNADELAAAAVTFKSEARGVEKAAKCRKIKMYAIIAAVILVILLIIIVPIVIKYT
ncbi:R-SNARE 3 [Giardia muris]|uniref:R-SNARE 3 n=1 Tax=Giardia muris TaxID=5742 RepID=A0A4Z1T4U8_GIAMU|nr:R-SNARE 3 [Giardia muris]|eukprot:TNJ27549.1 R-SNARE 3 [Giardia muris]